MPLVWSQDAAEKPNGNRRSNRREALAGTTLPGVLHTCLYVLQPGVLPRLVWCLPEEDSKILFYQATHSLAWETTGALEAFVIVGIAPATTR